MAVWVAEDFFVDAIVAVEARVGELEDWHAGLVGNILKRAVAFFLGKVAVAVGDNEAEIPSAGLIHAREINFVENAVAQGVPDPAVRIERGADAGFGAGGPAWRNARPTGREAFVGVGQGSVVPK